ncbi:NucA/NucB deoxyribonuclease domain-containing protein [Kitasatospora purpeofusca]|uniref:NucA/NucB deoxyribonuclease domain-containing protein n=1 Tax=Kitasatospora purpeofusca TaxID=67352 RepID=UPI0035D9325E
MSRVRWAHPGLEQECQAHPEADTPTGWIKNRFETCVHRHYDLVLRNTQGDKTLGRLLFDTWILGFAYDGQRKVDYVVSVRDIKVQTNGSEDATKWSINQDVSSSVNVPASDPGASIDRPSKERRDELLGSWDKNPFWTLTYTAPDKGPLYDQGNRQVVHANVLLSMGVTSPTAPTRPWQQTDVGHSNVRFDYAGPVAGKFRGTVFTQARAELVMKLSDPNVRESARHIKDAISSPERTFPSWVGKSVPGEKEPLHRRIDEKDKDENRKVAIKACEEVWGDYSGSGLECDEYPFATTYEGAAKANGRFSARLIDGTDNGRGGNMLKAVYTENRLLDNDPFYVRIDS